MVKQAIEQFENVKLHNSTMKMFILHSLYYLLIPH